MSEERSKELLAHYAQNPIDFAWIPSPNQHSYRWRTNKGRWVTARRRIRNHQTLAKAIGKDVVSDLYFSTSRWLNPIDLPRLRDKEQPHPILLDHLIVFDIDVAPLSLKNLEQARITAIDLHDYLAEDASIEFLSCSFSGSKGFHLFYLDMERDKFAIEDPKEREETVRESRKQLLKRVLEEGFNVDNRVTADTRRIIRLPGSIHGTTGYMCTVLGLEQLKKPLKDLLEDIPRIESAQKIPKRARKLKKKAKKKKKSKQRKSIVDTRAVQQYMVEVSTHVPGTKDRSVIMLWLPLAWGSGQKALETALDMINEENLGPCSFWQQGDHILMLCPLALPRAQVVKLFTSYKMSKRAAILKEREHDWIRITNTMDEDADWQDGLQPIGLYGDEVESKTSFSSSHLELERRMGIHRQVPSSATFAGKQEPTLRIAVRE
jgi:DNA primase catalytic subunit